MLKLKVQPLGIRKLEARPSGRRIVFGEEVAGRFPGRAGQGHGSAGRGGIAEAGRRRKAPGPRLRAVRDAALAEGMPVLTQDEVLAEVRRRRGEPADDDWGD
jgi:hypothetical protein